MQDYMHVRALIHIRGAQLIESPGLLLGMVKFMQSPKAGASFAKSYRDILWYDMMFTVCKFAEPVCTRI